MSDPMAGAMAQKAKMSVFNPNDASAMAAGGMVKPGMTVRQVLEQFGIDVEGPAAQLQQLAQQQMQQRTASGKAGMGGPPGAGGPPGMAPQGMRGMAPPPQSPGMESGGVEGLMRNIRS